MAVAGSARVPCFLFFLWLVGEEDGYVHLVKLCPFVRAAIVVVVSRAVQRAGVEKRFFEWVDYYYASRRVLVRYHGGVQRKRVPS